MLLASGLSGLGPGVGGLSQGMDPTFLVGAAGVKLFFVSLPGLYE